MSSFAYIKQSLYKPRGNTLHLSCINPKNDIKTLKRFHPIQHLKCFYITTVYHRRVNWSQQVHFLSTTCVIKKENEPKDKRLEGTTQNNKQNEVANKLEVPDICQPLLTLPISRRPLFPGFYKAVVVKDPQVVEAIKMLFKQGLPFVGAFLTKNDALDTDRITGLDQVHPVGIFAQITSIFPASAGSGQSGTDQGLTAVLYPHRRIRLTKLLRKDDVPLKEKKTEPNKGIRKSKSTSSSSSRKQQTVETQAAEKTEADPPPADVLLKAFDVSLGEVESLEQRLPPKNSSVSRALTSELMSVFAEIAQINPLFREQIANFSISQSGVNVFDEPSHLADLAAAVSAGESSELQDILDTLDVEDRLQKSLLVLKKELINVQLQNKIAKEVEDKIEKRQRDYYLKEQLKGIKKELGVETDGKDKLVDDFKEKAGQLIMPESAKKVFDEEINKLAHLEPAAPEFNVTRNYLDWITQLPWGRRSKENYNLRYARNILDEDHYGLKEVKDRILEFVAVGKLRGTVEGKILCLVGPPGVGKTSVGKSVARALDRKFFRFSIGGLTDVAEIKGHRRTYIGAMPGKVIQALKKVGTENPLILIDEIDKIGRGHQGDPSSALLELLDPEQNSSYLDHYMDIPVDLSKVLFMCTANVLDTIPPPLLDRMEIIQLSGYVAEEKAAIASKYLVPTAKIASGLERVDIHLTNDAIDTMIKSYCRESGVRNLKKQIDKVYRKAAYKIVEEINEREENRRAVDNASTTTGNIAKDALAEEKEMGENSLEGEVTGTSLNVPDNIHLKIDTKSLRDYVGPAIYHSDRLYETTPPGVVMGLAWTSIGGASLYVESVLESALTYKSKPGLSKTGQLGDVMKESTSIAYTFAKSLIAREFPKNRFFEKAHVHLHCPGGAVPKDGPSAGITMTTALLSLALNQPVDPNIAMTGELTVTGKVLQIGGLKEKVIAAKRVQVTKIIFPKDNEADWEELEDYIKKDIIGVPVDNYADVFKIVFGNVDRKQIENLWIAQLEKPGKEKEQEFDE